MILVTGCNSQLGTKILTKLADSGEKIRCLDFYKPKDLPSAVEFIQGDVRDTIILKKACQDVETIYHLMDITSPRKGKRFMKKVNVMGTGNLLDAAKTARVKKFIFLSSYEVYGKAKKIPTRQNDKKRPVTRYGKHKLKAEKLCWKAMEEKKLDVTIFRPSLIIGPGTDNPIILITLLMAMGMEDANRMYIAGDGDTRFQLIHPDDVAAAMAGIHKNEKSKSKIYNLGSDHVPTQIEQIVKIKEVAKLDCVIKHLSPGYTRFLSIILKPFKINYLNREHLVYLLRNIILDCQQAKQDLDWEPTKNNIDILLETIKWYRDEKL